MLQGALLRVTKRGPEAVAAICLWRERRSAAAEVAIVPASLSARHRGLPLAVSCQRVPMREHENRGGPPAEDSLVSPPGAARIGRNTIVRSLYLARMANALAACGIREKKSPSVPGRRDLPDLAVTTSAALFSRAGGRRDRRNPRRPRRLSFRGGTFKPRLGRARECCLLRSWFRFPPQNNWPGQARP